MVVSNRVSTIIGTFFYAGFFPFAPATFASLVFVLAYTLVPGGKLLAHPLIALATVLVAVPVATRLERLHGADAGCIVIDEVVGMQISLTLSEPGAWGAWAAFLLFRFYDIVKPFPAGRSQRLPGGYGVVADDAIAGVYTRLTLILLGWVFPAIGRMV
jgi:phosphatidylglycerophosphatase A